MEDHARLRPYALDQLGGGQSVHPRHLDVEKRDVGRTGDRQPRSFFAIFGLTHDLDLGMEAQQRAQEHAGPLMIVGDHEPSASFRAAFLHFGPPDSLQPKSYGATAPNHNLGPGRRRGPAATRVFQLVGRARARRPGGVRRGTVESWSHRKARKHPPFGGYAQAAVLSPSSTDERSVRVEGARSFHSAIRRRTGAC